MKKILLLATLLSIAALSRAQLNTSIWQGVVRDAAGKPLANQTVELQVKITVSNISSAVETYSVATDEQGVALVNFSATLRTDVIAAFQKLPPVIPRQVISLKQADETWLTLADEEIPSVPFAENAYYAQMPVGTIATWIGPTSRIPTGWLLCNGASMSRSSYAELYNVIGTAWGTASSTTFNLPDMRGVFLRGVDGTAGRDADKASRTAIAAGGNTGNNVGSYQADEFKSHTHTYTDWGGGSSNHADTDGTNFTTYGTNNGTYTTDNTISDSPITPDETRPNNIAVYYIVKYRRVE
jgi:microcystin-dependent protein